MRKRLDNIFSAAMLIFGVAAVLAGFWCLLHSIGQARETEPVVIVRYIPAQAEPEASPEPALAVPTAPVPSGYDPAVPLSPELQVALYEACREADVPVSLALGLIEVESRFDPQADNGKCYGLCQLNRDYFPDKLSPADNIREGVAYLGRLLERCGDPAAALTAYNAGHDTGARDYANAVLKAAERWPQS